jgi:tetratricopeptide (TPR) repeat protein
VPTISEPESETISQHWVKIETDSRTAQNTHLEDTQKIVIHEVQGDSLQTARIAIDEKNYEDAIRELDNLVEKGTHLEEIIHLLEDTQTVLTQGSDAWFILGKAYLKTDQKEKALQAFHNAEKNTTI